MSRRLGQTRLETAQKRLEELFDRLEPIRDAFVTHKWYSQAQLKVIEGIVLAVAGDDFALGANARRWLDDDEFLVRRRIHAEYRAAAGACKRSRLAATRRGARWKTRSPPGRG